MAKLLEINPLILPKDYAEFRKPEYQYKKNGEILENFDIQQFDGRTVFYDVFFNKDGSKLHAVGPPFLNLSKYFEKMEIILNGRKIPYSIQTFFNRVLCLTAKIKDDLRMKNTIQINFTNYQWSTEIKFEKIKQVKKLALTTIQKDNKIHWILDWIKYYSATLDVNQFIIYDNNSAYQSELVDILPDNALIVPWNFPYGITDSNLNKFLHVGQLNHSRLRFENIKVFLNFDIDEILVIKNERIRELISKYWALVFNSYNMCYPSGKNKDYSFGDFNKRKKSLRNTRKYSFKTGKSLKNNVHKVKINGFIKRIFIWFLVKKVPVDQAYFLHYSAITTDWKYKTSLDRKRKSRLNPKTKKEMVIDDHVKNILDRN